MSSISGIGIGGYDNTYAQLASGNRLNRAADGAAELSIAERETVQASGLDRGAANAADGSSLLNVADGALAGVADYLQGIRELAVQASNSAVYSSDDIRHMQEQVDQYKKGIADIADQTMYNTKPLLNGSTGEMNIATDSNGGGTKVSTGNATLKELGIEDFDLTKDFDIGKIDKALEKINTQRGNIGAKTNALEHLQNYNYGSSYNHTSAVSKLKDTNYPQAIEKLKRQQALQAYALTMQKRNSEDEERRNINLFKR